MPSLTALCTPVLAGAVLSWYSPTPALPPSRMQTSAWEVVRLDLDLQIDTATRSLHGTSTIRLRLTDAAADSLAFEVGSASRLIGVRCPSGPMAVADAEGRRASCPGLSALRPGTEVEVQAQFTNRGQTFQFIVSPKAALASWARNWYPSPTDGDTRAPGLTTIHMPPGWHSLSNGTLADSTLSGGERMETWRTDVPMARSFIAAPYTVTRRVAAGRTVSAYWLGRRPQTGAIYADTVARVIDALTPTFGPYPYGGYAVAEVPEGLVEWGGSSEQGFFMSDALADRVNLPLLAHELSHGWWGNRVGSAAPASLMSDEALAQLRASLAIEALEGEAAVRDFMRFSRDGYSSRQSARGYFTLRRLGHDKPLSELTGEGDDHDLSDAKGHWFYWMLRDRVGAAAFAKVMKQLQDSFAGRRMSLTDLRTAFVTAGPPSADLPIFFAEWLDRAGAPDLTIAWRHGGTDLQPTAIVTATQRGPLYHLLVEVAVRTPAGSTTRMVRLNSRTQTVTFRLRARPTAVELDPRYRILRWDPDYGPLPDR